MIKFSNKEYAEMMDNLKRIASETENNLQRAEQSYHAIQDSLERLKGFILTYTFQDATEEILFFKEFKPRFIQELIYFKELFYMEANMPIGSKEVIMAYYKQITERIRLFFERNQLLHIYYRSGKSNHDDMFFLRDSEHPLLLQEHSPDLDNRFCTVNSFKLGKMLAFEKLNIYIENEIDLLQNDLFPIAKGNVRDVSLPWTDKKAWLVELLYGIHVLGSLNNAHADLKQIAILLETAFDTDLGNYSRTFQEMCLRKKSPTPYLDRMIEMLVKRMGESSE